MVLFATTATAALSPMSTLRQSLRVSPGLIAHRCEYLASSFCLIGHDLLRKPASTFRDHALKPSTDAGTGRLGGRPRGFRCLTAESPRCLTAIVFSEGPSCPSRLF